MAVPQQWLVCLYFLLFCWLCKEPIIQEEQYLGCRCLKMNCVGPWCFSAAFAYSTFPWFVVHKVPGCIYMSKAPWVGAGNLPSDHLCSTPSSKIGECFVHRLNTSALCYTRLKMAHYPFPYCFHTAALHYFFQHYSRTVWFIYYKSPASRSVLKFIGL